MVADSGLGYPANLCALDTAGTRQAGKFVAGLRLSDAQMRQHEGRATERQGTLRPTVAAMMVELAGPAKGLLLDPCCGSGTPLEEARATGWDDVAGSDIDPDAVDVARTNVPEAEVGTADARQLDLADGSVRACVSNLPFGRQFEVQGDMNQWLNTVLREMTRITVDGGRIVLLAPKIPRAVVPASLHPTGQHDIVLLGTRTSIWCYEKRGRVDT